MSIINLFLLSLVAVSLLAPAGVSRAGVRYPENPYIYGNGIYVSEQGISRLDANTLKPVWQRLRGIATLEPVVTDRLLLVGSPNGLYALDRKSGLERWHIGAGLTVFSPVVSGNLAFVAARDGSLQAVEMETGSIRWRREFKGWVYPPAVIGGRLVVGGSAHVLTGLSVATGSILWEKTLEQEMVYRPQATPGSDVIITLFSGQILAINPEDGSTQWQVTDNAPSFPPVTGNGLLYFRTYDGKLKARCQIDGRLVWENTVGARLTSPPRISGSTVVIGNDQGKITAYDGKTGKQMWLLGSDAELIGSPVVINNRVVVFTTRNEGDISQSITPNFLKTINQPRRKENEKISSSRCVSHSVRFQR